MAITYNWAVATMERNTSDNGVVTVHWRCDATEGEHSIGAYGTTGHTPDPSASDFVEYDSLTEAGVLVWVYAQVDQAQVESALADKIAEMKNPPVVAGTPWSV